MEFLRSGECLVAVLHGFLAISLELSLSGCSILKGSFAILTSIWRMELDTWPPSRLVKLLVKYCCCSISGRWFDGVVLVIPVVAGNLEYVIVIYEYFRMVNFQQILEYLSGSLQIYTDSHRNFSKTSIKSRAYLVEHFLITISSFKTVFITS